MARRMRLRMFTAERILPQCLGQECSLSGKLPGQHHDGRAPCKTPRLLPDALFGADGGDVPRGRQRRVDGQVPGFLALRHRGESEEQGLGSGVHHDEDVVVVPVRIDFGLIAVDQEGKGRTEAMWAGWLISNMILPLHPQP